MPAASEPTQIAPTKSKLSREDQEDLDAVNASIDRMRTLTAPDPYFLTIPQDVEPRYHHTYQYQAMQWLHLTPFEWKDGEALQYQTYIYHEHGMDMYVLHNSLPRDEREVPASVKNRPATGPGTPSAGDKSGPKKKITLDAYKKSKTGGVTPAQADAPAVKAVEAAEKKAAVKGPVERVKAETEEVLAAVEEGDEVLGIEEAKVEENEKQQLKRKREQTEESQDQIPERPAAHASEPAAKKARTSSPKHVVAREPPTLQKVSAKPLQKPPTPPTHGDEAGLPPKLSPPPQPVDHDLPPKLSPLHVPDLPTRLSPTIPANIAETIKARGDFKAGISDSTAPTSTSKNGTLTPPRAISGVTKRKSPIPRNAFRANSSSPAVHSDAEQVPKPAATSVPAAKTPDLSADEERAVGSALKAKRRDKPSQIVKLRYQKSQREAIRRILKLRPNPAKALTTKQSPPSPSDRRSEEVRVERRASIRRDTNVKGVAQKIGPPAKGVAQKIGPPPKGSDAERPEDSGRPATSAETETANQRTTDEARKLVKLNVVPGKKPFVESVPDKSDTQNHAPVSVVSKSAKDASAPPKQPAMRRYDPPARQRESANKPVLPADSRRRSKELANNSYEAASGQDKTAEAKQSQSAQPEARTTKRKASSDTATIEAEVPPTKRKKVPDAIETKKEPRTPLHPDLTSPSLTSSMPKSQQVTPTIRKDHLSAVAMVRELSAEGNVNTPSSVKSSTPVAVNGHASQGLHNDAKPPSSQPSTRTPKQSAWETEQKRLEGIGRKLKHAASAHLDKLKLVQSDPKGGSTEHKLAAIKSLESLLAYFLAFTCGDQAALAAEPRQHARLQNWKTLHGFFGFVKRNCETLPLLSGLASHLGVIYAARILEIGTHQSKQAAQDVAYECSGIMFKNVRDAEVKLGLDALTEHFPNTWRARVKDTGAADDVIEPGSFRGNIVLPLGLQTSPLRAARAGYALLQEWMTKEGIDYELVLKLDNETRDA
jgi:hypothetical protein